MDDKTVSLKEVIAEIDAMPPVKAEGHDFIGKTCLKTRLELLPPAQPGCEDAVPRTSVEYICKKNTVSTNPYEHKYHDKFIQFMDNPEISDFGRWQHSNGFNTALVAVKCDLDKVPSVTPKQPGWISVTKQLPENEQEVFVTVEVRPFGQKPFRRVVRAFYTDGKHTDVDSAYFWDEFPDPQYDDDDNMIIPEGWWEASDYSEQQGMIDDFVIAWRERLEPWEGAEDAGEN